MNHLFSIAGDHSRRPLVDSFGRVHTSLRLSVTDRCNIRCFYCMPAEGVRFLPRSQILTFEEIERFVRVVATLGISRIRITGGEPLVRSELPKLVAKLASIPGVDELAITTNGMLLAEQADALREAGLARLNISLDTLDPQKFQELTRREGLDRVLAGIDAAQQAGFHEIRLNAIAIHGQTEPEIVPLTEFALSRGLHLRFIEYMPLDGEQQWRDDLVLSGEQIRQVIERHFGSLVPAGRSDPAQPAVDYQFVDRAGGVGFINPVSQPFCGGCDRLRLTAEGQIRNCLFARDEWDARALLRSGGGGDELAEMVRQAVAAKQPGHGIADPGFLRPERAMYQIGG